MSVRLALAFALATLVLPFALHAGALAWLPDGWRLVLAFAAVVLLPGHALLAATGARPPGGAWLSSGWALGLGVAWTGALVLATRALHLPFTVLAPWGAPVSAALWALPAAFGRPAPGPQAPRLSPRALLAVLAAALLAAWVAARLGTPVSYYTDSPDHIGTIRRMMASGDAFPTDAFFRDAGPLGIDPRKGLWHPCVALIATLARLDPLVAWRALAAILAPLFAINAAAFAFLLGGGTTAAVGAWALVLTYGGGLATGYLREAVFATKLADQLALATAAAVLADLERPSRGGRLAAVGLALGAVATHVFAAIQFGVVFGALGVGLLVRDRGAGPAFRRLAATCMAMALAALPYLAWRARFAYAPNNVIHTEPQGLFYLTRRAFIVSPGVLWDWTGHVWLFAPLWAAALVRAARRAAPLMLLTTSIAVAAILFVPPVTMALQPRLGYLLMRFTWLVPFSGLVAFAVQDGLDGWRDGSAARRVRAAAALAVAAYLLRHPVLDALAVVRHPDRLRAAESEVSVERWRDGLAWMDRHLPAGTVVLSDPATSYSIPMMTRDYVATLVDQHSSPNDSLALRRMLDARDALDPHADWATTRAIVARYGVGAIALNDRFAEVPRLDYWAPSHEWFGNARARLDARPAAFRRVYDRAGFVVYAVNRAALDTLTDGGRPRDYVVPATARAAARARAIGPRLPDLVDASLSPAAAAPGDSVVIALAWHAGAALPAGSYREFLRFDTGLPAGVRPPAWLAKPVRKLVERRLGRRFRFRVDRLPVDGDYGVDQWRPDEIVRDTAIVVVPADVAPGDYRAQVRLVRTPHYPNLRLHDYLYDDDYFTGLPIGTLRVAAGAPAAGPR